MDKSISRIALVSIGALAIASPALAEHSWSTYHWNTIEKPAPFNVYVNVKDYWRTTQDEDNVTHDVIREAIADWDNPNSASLAPHTSEHPDGGKTHDMISGTAGDYLNPTERSGRGGDPRKCNPISGAIYVCSHSYGYRGWLGLATIWTSGGHIVQATTKLNDSYHSALPYSSYSWRATVACQEIGHDFGLGHQDANSNNDTSGSCMEYTNLPAGNESPDWHDFDQLQTIYQGHLSGHSTASVTSAGAGSGANSDAFTFRQVGSPPPAASEAASKDWGRIVGYDSHGRPNRFEMDLANGLRKHTHVTWVPGFRPEKHHMGDHD